MDMKGFTPSDIPTLGDTSLPWYDKNWPWNLGRVATFAPSYSFYQTAPMNEDLLLALSGGEPIELLDIDFSKVSPIAMWAGRGERLWEHCEPQQLLVRFDGRWLVLCRHITEYEVSRFFFGDSDATNDAVRDGVPYQKYVDLGREGHREEYVYGEINADSEATILVFNPNVEPSEITLKSLQKRRGGWLNKVDHATIHCFKGDFVLKRVVEFLATFGVVQSKHWPIILEMVPALREFQDYLIYANELWPDGTHPLNQTMQLALASESEPETNSSPLTLAKIPMLDKKSGEWIMATSPRMVDYWKWVHTTLATSRSQGQKAVDGSHGISEKGFAWRRDPEDERVIWYLESTLEKNRRPKKPKPQCTE